MKILARFNFVAFFISVKEADSYKYSPSRLTLHAYNFLRTTTEDKRHTNVFIMYTETTFLRAFYHLLRATKLIYELFITCFNRLSANDQSTDGFLNQLDRHSGMQASLQELTSLTSFLVMVADLVSLSARSLSQSDFLGRCST